MRNLFLLLLAILTSAACTQKTTQRQDEMTSAQKEVTVSQGQALLNILNADNHSLVVLNNDSLSYYNGRGVQDLLQLLREDSERLKGAIVADKMVGKAAAALMVAGGVREVNTNLICTPALEVFRTAGVTVHYTEEVPQILNRDLTSQCPIDALLNEAETVEECVAILDAKFQN